MQSFIQNDFLGLEVHVWKIKNTNYMFTALNSCGIKLN